MSKVDINNFSDYEERKTNNSHESNIISYFNQKAMNTSALSQKQFNTEFSLLIKHLLHDSTENHVEIIHSIRRLIKNYVFSGNFILPEFSKKIIFEKFYQFLIEEQSNSYLNRVLTEYTILISELLTIVPMYVLEQDNCLFLVLPHIIPNLGHEAIEVRRATLKFLHVYVRYTKHLNGLIDLYINYGLKSNKKNAQKGCILSLPLLFTQEFFNYQENLNLDKKSSLNLFPLLQCLSDLLIHADARLFYAIYLAIQRLHVLLGNRVFKLYLQRVDQEAVLLYEKVLSRNASTASSKNENCDNSNNFHDYAQDNQTVDRLIVSDKENTNNFNKINNRKNYESNSKEEAIPLERIISKGEIPNFDKYDKLMLDQLVSNEEDSRKQSFDILSSPTSLIQDEFMNDEDFRNQKNLDFLDQKGVYNTKKILAAEQETKNAIKDQVTTSKNETNNLIENSSDESRKPKHNKNKNENFKNKKDSTDSVNKHEFNFGKNSLIYGIFPSFIIEKALNSKLALKNEAINQILSIVKQIPCTQLTILTLNNNLNNFFLDFLIKLIDHPNFKITLQAFEIIETLVNRLKNQIINYLHTLINILVKRLGDSRVVVRQQTIQIVHLITLKLPTQAVIDALLPHLNNRNPRVRTEIINRITVILLLIPRDQFNLCALCYDLSSLLVDDKRIVRQAVLECMAVLAQCLGSDRTRKLIRCVEAIERVQGTPGLVAAVKARLARRDLPRVLPDATVRFVLNPNGFSGWYPSLADADIDWILQGSTSATSTPPKFIIKTPVNYCASYQDLSNSGRICEMKRNSCVLNNHDTEYNNFLNKNTSNFSNKTFHGIKQSITNDIQMPPDTGKQSESTIEIERLIEKNMTDQLKSRDISTGESIFSNQSEDHNSEDSRDLWCYYYEKFQNNNKEEQTFNKNSSYFDKNEFRIDFEESNNLNNDEKFLEENQNYNLANYSKQSNIRNSSKAISMPAIDSAHLSDISERSEITSKSPHKNLSSSNLLINKEKKKESLEGILSSYPSDGEASDKTLVSVIENPKSNNYKNEIEIKVHKASTISDEAKSMAGNDKMNSDSKDSHEHENGFSEEEIKEKKNYNDKNEIDISKRKVSIAVPNGNIQNFKESDEENNQSSNGLMKIESEKVNETENFHLKSAKRRESRSTSPQKRKHSSQVKGLEIYENSNQTKQSVSQQLVRIQPAIPSNANIRNILENVTKTEGSFKEPEEALKSAISAFTQDTWTTKIEAMLAITRLATFHPNVLKRELHTIVLALAYEIKNLRSTVARSAIYTLGDLLVKMRGFIDIEMDVIAQALLHKSGENIQFMREDIEKALDNFVNYMPPVRASLAIINHGANHRNVFVRRISSNYLANLVELMGPTKALLGPRDLAENLLPTTASLLLDRDLQTRYSAKRIFNVLINHVQFDVLLGKHVQPATYRAIIGSLQSIKRRGIGEKPIETIAK